MTTTESSVGNNPRWGRLVTGLVVFVVLLALPPPGTMEPGAWRVSAVAALMTIWWITEAMPIPATALLPIVLFPLLGVASVSDATAPYANPLVFLFLGGFIIALAMERCNLHRRIALNIIRVLGTRPSAILMGFMIASAFLSMWISNTATALMMLPIALSIIALTESGDDAWESRHARNFGLALLLGIAYACNVGGIGTLVGTPPNALLAGYMLDQFDVEIGFVRWMMLGVPITVVSLIVIYLTLSRFLFPLEPGRLPGGQDVIQDKLAAMGPMSGPEKRVALVFALTAGLWITRPLLEPLLPGLSDTGIAMFGGLLMFLLPGQAGPRRRLLAWEDTRRLPWGILILFGGGLSLAAGISDSGLAEWLGSGLRGLDGLAIVWLILLTAVLIVLLTEVTSNTATTAAFLPIATATAITLGHDPLLLAVPVAIAASCAFMLPVATPPNAIVFGSGRISIPQMARAGVALNLLMVLVVTGGTYALMGLIFSVG